MSRPFSPGERALLAGAEFGIHGRCEIQNADASWIDVTSWWKKSNWLDDLDNPVAGGSGTFLRDKGASSFAPLVTESLLNRDDADAYAPLAEGSRGIRFLSAITEKGDAPAEDQWKEVFTGAIDETDAASGGELVTVTFRDLGKRLLDKQIEAKRIYSTPSGTAVEAVMQQIIDDNLGPGVVELYTPVSPGWFIKKYEQERVKLLEAIRALALQIGWDVRYKYDAAGISRLTFYRPDRAKVAADFTLARSEYLSIEKLLIGDQGIINRVKIVWYEGGKVRREKVYQNDASIQKYGVRFGEVAEDKTSNIDSEAEADRMGEGMVADLGFPKASQRVKNFFFWPAEVGDYVAYPANPRLYTDPQTLATVQINWELSPSDGRTSIEARGDVSGAYADWLRSLKPNGPPRIIPAPEFSQLFGEGSGFGGTTGDGYTWLWAKFNEAVRAIRITAEEGDTPDTTPQPDQANNSTSIDVTRGDGEDASAPNFETVIGIATRPGRTRRITAVGLGNTENEQSPEYTPDPAIAEDPTPTPIDGEILGVSGLGGFDQTAFSILLGNIETDTATPGNWLFVMRNSLVIYKLWLGYLGNRTVFYTDRLINIDTTYTYEFFVWNGGVSGKKWRWTEGSIDATPPIDADPRPRFINSTPKTESQSGVLTLVAEYVVNDPGAMVIELQFSFEGVAGWLPATGGRSAIVGTTGILIDAAPSAYTGGLWYRLVTYSDALGSIVRKVGAAVWFPPQGAPPSGGGIVPVFEIATVMRNGFPRLSISWTCNNTAAANVSIEESDDEGVTDPWAEIFRSGSVASGTWNSDLSPWINRDFRMKALAADGSTLGISAVTNYSGVLT